MRDIKPSPVRSEAARRAARGSPCSVRIAGVCDGGGETTVLAHSNLLMHGKGMGRKADDHWAAFACFGCHNVLDGRAPRPPGVTLEMVYDAFLRGVGETHRILEEKGVKWTTSESSD